MSPDLAVSEMEEYGTLDGMRVGPLATGEIGPFSSLRLEIVWQPTLPGRVDPDFLVSFADPLSEPVSLYLFVLHIACYVPCVSKSTGA